MGHFTIRLNSFDFFQKCRPASLCSIAVHGVRCWKLQSKYSIFYYERTDALCDNKNTSSLPGRAQRGPRICSVFPVFSGAYIVSPEAAIAK